MATSGENYWPPTGRTSWPLTREGRRVVDQGASTGQRDLPRSPAACVYCRNFPYRALAVVGRCGIDVNNKQIATAVAER